MTFLEKLKEEYPDREDRWYGFKVEDECPHEYWIEGSNENCDMNCLGCWNREMPNTEQLTDNERKIDAMSENAYNKGLNDGRNEVWELLDRIEHAIKSSVLIEVFGYSNIGDILDHFTPQEALAKLKEYEEAQNKVKVGDVVKTKGCEREYVVMATSEETFSKQHFLRCTEPPYYVLYGSDEELEKTGRHINILEQIGE